MSERVPLPAYVTYLLRRWHCVVGKCGKHIDGSTHIWYNKWLTRRMGSKRESLRPEKLGQMGFNRVGDFLDTSGQLLSYDEAVKQGLPDNLWLSWESITGILKANMGDEIIFGSITPDTDLSNGPPESTLPPHLTSERGREEISDWSQKTIKRAIAASRLELPNDYIRKVRDELDMDEEEWLTCYRRAVKVFKDSKSKDFTARYMHGAVFCNHRMSICFPAKQIDKKCQFCNEPSQTRKHFFRECPFVMDLRKDVERAIFHDSLTHKEWVVGTEAPEENMVIWFFLKYIYDQNNHQNTPTLAGLEGHIAEWRTIEYEIALKNGGLKRHLAKWQDFDALRMLGRKK